MSKSNGTSIGAKLKGAKGAIIGVAVILGILIAIFAFSYCEWALFPVGTYQVGALDDLTHKGKYGEIKLGAFGSCEYTFGNSTNEYAYEPLEGGLFSNTGIYALKDGDNLVAYMKRGTDNGYDKMIVVPETFGVNEYEIVDNGNIVEFRTEGTLEQIMIKEAFVSIKAGDDVTIGQNGPVFEAVKTTTKNGKTTEKLDQLVFKKKDTGAYTAFPASQYTLVDKNYERGVYELTQLGKIVRLIVCEEDCCVVLDNKDKKSIVYNDADQTYTWYDAPAEDAAEGELGPVIGTVSIFDGRYVYNAAA